MRMWCTKVPCKSVSVFVMENYGGICSSVKYSKDVLEMLWRQVSMAGDEENILEEL